MSFEIAIILLLILANGLFSMSEISIVSSKKVRLKRKAQQGHKGAQTALELSEEPNRFLSTVQVGITLIGVFTGVYGGTTIAGKLEPLLQQFPMVAYYAKGLSLTIVTLATTYLTLVFGELVPKRIGLQRPEVIASAVAPLMKGISRVGAPFVWLLSSSTDLILKVLGMTKMSDATVSEEEIKAIIEESAAGGIIEVSEQKMVEQVFRLSDHTINMLMTPRIDLVWLDINDSFETNLQLIHENDYTHFLVADGDLDQVIGILHIRDLLKNISIKEQVSIDFRKLAKEPLYVPESMRPFKLLEQFKEHDVHLAIVIDEFGTIQGVITLNDVMQDITDASHDLEDEENGQIVRRDDGSYFVDGMLGKNELKEFLEINELLDEEENYYTTAAGFLMYSLKKVPRLGEHFVWKGIDFEIADMDGNRVDKIIVRFPDQNVDPK